MNIETQKNLAELFDIVIGTPSANHRVDSRTGLTVIGDISSNLYKQLVTEHRTTYADDKLFKTMYASEKAVLDKNLDDLIANAVQHYASTNGNKFVGKMYIPNDSFGVVKGDTKVLPVRVVRVVTQEQARERVADFVNSGIALKQETCNMLFKFLVEVNYDFAKYPVRNKEMSTMAADVLGIMPQSAEDFLRYVIYVSSARTSTLLIKNARTIELIKSYTSTSALLAKYNEQYSLRQLAESFNRFKPLFLALKKGPDSKRIVNKIAKLSKRLHKPMVQNPVNTVTSQLLRDEDEHWLTNATTWVLLRALDAIEQAQYEPDFAMYQIRNGRTWAKDTRVKTLEQKPGERMASTVMKTRKRDLSLLLQNRKRIVSELRSRIDGKGKTVYIPSYVNYALPTSEKSFIGCVPTMSRVTNPESITVGIYWEDSWGANDLDLSSLDINGEKVGWNSNYYNERKSVVYSGDITSAPNGATEYLTLCKGSRQQLVHVNVYSGSEMSEFDVIVGTQGDPNVRKGPRHGEAWIHTEDRLLLARHKTPTRGCIIGFTNEADTGEFEFVFSNLGVSNNTVAGYTETSQMMLKAIQSKNATRMSLADVLVDLGYTVTHDSDVEHDHSLELSELNKASIVDLLGVS